MSARVSKSEQFRQGIRDLASAIAETVFAPDYYCGPWYVSLERQRPDGSWFARRRNCSGHSTAVAWAKYLRRHGYRFIAIGKIR